MSKTRRYIYDKFDEKQEDRFTGNKKVRQKMLNAIDEDESSEDPFADEMSVTDQIFITHTKHTN